MYADSPKQDVLIGILYIAIGKYSVLWNDFYKSAEEYLFPVHPKTYFVFTDDEDLLSSEVEKVRFIKQEDLGWPANTLGRFAFFKKVEEQLHSFHYLFFFNGDYFFLDKILLDEVRLVASNDYWTTLVWHRNLEKKNVDEMTYDRNEKSKAYIPYGQGRYYYQGGFYGSDPKHFFDLVDTCLQWIEEDEKNGVVALWHDESYLNRYMLNKNPKFVSTGYGKPQQWKYPQAKAILRKKKDILGKNYLKRLKSRKKKESLWNSLSQFFSSLFL